MTGSPAASHARRVLDWASRQGDIADAVRMVGDGFAHRTPPARLLYVEDRLRIPFGAPRPIVFALRSAGDAAPEANLRFDFDPATGTVSATVSGTVKLRRRTALDDFTPDWAGRIARDAMIAALRAAAK
jgi:hypothetical protein